MTRSICECCHNNLMDVVGYQRDPDTKQCTSFYHNLCLPCVFEHVTYVYNHVTGLISWCSKAIVFTKMWSDDKGLVGITMEGGLFGHGQRPVN